jgi:hypothetical protein
MKAQVAYPAGFGVCLAVLALSVGGQTTTGNQAHVTTDATKTATANPTATSASNSTQHHATAHHQGKAKHKNMSAATPGNEEATYQAALKQCVVGPVAQRDSCLDSAIARFGRA